MVTGIIGKKVGMTQLVQQDGSVQPATVLKAGPCVVAQVKTVDNSGNESSGSSILSATPTAPPVGGTGSRATPLRFPILQPPAPAIARPEEPDFHP